MIYLATEKAVKEMNENKIDEKDVLMDRAIIKHKGNPLERLLNIIVEMDGLDKVKITHPEDEGKLEYKEVNYVNGIWI